ncbi:MAG: hypothetical protein ACTHOE_12500 [Conexibacter sp.]
MRIDVGRLPWDLAGLDAHIEQQAHAAHASKAQQRLAQQATPWLYADYKRVARLQQEPISSLTDFKQGFVGNNSHHISVDTVLPKLLAHRCLLAERFGRVRYSHGLDGIIRQLYARLDAARTAKGLDKLRAPGC